jgi:hypothetical protein
MTSLPSVPPAKSANAAVRIDRCHRAVFARELVDGDQQGGHEPAVGAHGRQKGGRVTREMKRSVHTGRVGGQHLRGHVLCAVDDLRSAECGHLALLVVGVRGGDHARTGLRQQLNGLVADTAGCARNQDRLSGLRVGGVHCGDCG